MWGTQGWIHQLYLLHFILFSVYVNLRLAYVSRYIVLNTGMSHLSREEQSARCWLLPGFLSLWLRSGLQRTPVTGQAVAHPFLQPSPPLWCSGCWTRAQLSWPQHVSVSAVLTAFPATASVQRWDQSSPYLSWKFRYLLDWPKHKDGFQSTFLHHFTAALCWCQSRRAGLRPAAQNKITKALSMFVILHEHELNST